MRHARRRYMYALILTGWSVAAAVGQDIDPPMHHRLIIVSEPAGAEVWNADSLLGRTPVAIDRSLRDSVLIWYPSRSTWDARSYPLPRDAIDAEHGVVLLRCAARIRVVTEPPGAAVYLGDSLLGRSPLWTDPVDDVQRITIRKPGYLPRSVPLQALPGEAAVILLDIDPEAMRISDVEIRRSGLRLPPLDVVVPSVVGLAGGIAAVILKQAADNAYDQYLANGDAEKLRTARRLDIQAGVSMAVMELSLLWLIHLLFRGG